ncbi:hypothetical protein SEEE9317_22920, partial [Salmonella enterica subsp. enterica serovar Enteritidis str. 648899 3-17]
LHETVNIMPKKQFRE